MKALILLPALLTCTAWAGTITYNFDETGWANSFGTTENFFGSFTGSPDANGDLTLATLTSFSATITETNSTNNTKAISVFGSPTGIAGLTDFIYLPAVNSLNLAAAGTPGAEICLGSDVSTGACGSLPARPQPRPGTPPLPPIEGLFQSSVNGALDAYTTSLPSVTPLPVIQPVPAPSPVPEPGTMALCGVGFMLASKFLGRYRRRTAAASR